MPFALRNRTLRAKLCPSGISLQNREVQLTLARRIVHDLDLDDPPILYLEHENGDESAARRHDDAGRAVHEHDATEARETRERARTRDDGVRASDDHGTSSRRLHRSAVDSQHDLRIEHREQRSKVTV